MPKWLVSALWPLAVAPVMPVSAPQHVRPELAGPWEIGGGSRARGANGGIESRLNICSQGGISRLTFPPPPLGIAMAAGSGALGSGGMSESHRRPPAAPAFPRSGTHQAPLALALMKTRDQSGCLIAGTAGWARGIPAHRSCRRLRAGRQARPACSSASAHQTPSQLPLSPEGRWLRRGSCSSPPGAPLSLTTPRLLGGSLALFCYWV
jgi:hypothetical protein